MRIEEMDIKTLIAVATGKIPHNYRSGICPDELQPDSRDPDCPACKILIEAEHDKIGRPAAYIEEMERELRAAEIRLHDVAAHCANVEAELAEIKPAKPATRDDSARLDFLDQNLAMFPIQMGWNVGVAPGGNVSITTVIGGQNNIRESIDFAMQSMKGAK